MKKSPIYVPSPWDDELSQFTLNIDSSSRGLLVFRGYKKAFPGFVATDLGEQLRVIYVAEAPDPHVLISWEKGLRTFRLEEWDTREIEEAIFDGIEVSGDVGVGISLSWLESSIETWSKKVRAHSMMVKESHR